MKSIRLILTVICLGLSHNAMAITSEPQGAPWLHTQPNGFSKKRRNLEAQVFLVMAYYNFVLKHGTLKLKGQTGRTPAMAASLADRPWTMRDLMTFRIVEI